MSFVIGTAGHVDHGKSSLVQALTGIDPDRLAEEKARQLTIDLGFAWLKLAGLDEEVGMVDVPGHRDFIENMLAGVGGIDTAVFVVAADEGVMPQTREHLAILDLLDVPRGLIALTKVDLVEDEDWLALVEMEVAETVAGTVLAGAEMVPVSAKTGVGLPELRAALVRHLQQARPRPNSGRPRLPIDRVFSVAGFGTVVTGTLMGGQLRVGERVGIEPAGLTGRVRGLQSHRTKREVAEPGSRVAVNLAGVDKHEVGRGQVVAGLGVVRPTVLFDAAYRHLETASQPLRHNAEVKLFVGSAEVVARARVLGQAEIAPGERGWVQWALRSAVAVLRGDRFIVRRPSPAQTLGGGAVLDAHPGRQHRRFRAEVVGRLETLAGGTAGDLLAQTLARVEPIGLKKLRREAGLAEGVFEGAVAEMLAERTAVQLGSQLLTQATYQRLAGEMRQMVGAYHEAYPLRLGISREEVRSKLRVMGSLFADLVARSEVVQAGALLKLPEHEIVLSVEQKGKVARLEAHLAAVGVMAPSAKELQAMVGEDLFFALVDLGELVLVDEKVVYGRGLYEQLRGRLVDSLRENGTLDAAQARDILQTSRKYAIAFLEHLDAVQVTRRVGDVRRER